MTCTQKVPGFSPMEDISVLGHAAGCQQQLALRVAELAGVYVRVGGDGAGHRNSRLVLGHVGGHEGLCFWKCIWDSISVPFYCFAIKCASDVLCSFPSLKKEGWLNLRTCFHHMDVQLVFHSNHFASRGHHHPPRAVVTRLYSVQRQGAATEAIEYRNTYKELTL